MITHNGGFNRRARTDSTQLYSTKANSCAFMVLDLQRERRSEKMESLRSKTDHGFNKVVRLLMGSLSQYCEGGRYSRGGNDDRRLVIVLSYLSLYLEYYNGK